MKMTRANLSKILNIKDESKRKAKLQEFCLSIGWHGGIFDIARSELDRLEKSGIKTSLEQHLLRQV